MANCDTPKAEPWTRIVHEILADPKGLFRERSDLRSDGPAGAACNVTQATRFWYSPHIDEILCQRNGVRIPGYGDRAVRCSALSLLTVADSDHGARYLTDLGDLGTALADDATDQLVWHGHLVCLIVRRRLLSVCIARTQLASSQSR